MRREIFDVPGFQPRDEARARVVRYRDGAKRVLDIAGVLALAPLAVPLIGVLWGLARCDGGPGLFAHGRVGQDGKEFRCWKIRTMVPDARTRLRAHLATDPDAMREWQQNFKLSNDPRVTRLGRFLRATSLDELPQLWNVWRGEMSLVGPRPVPRDELLAYAGFERAYYLLRPGITGLWQVSGRNATTYEDRVRLDADYARRASILLDLGILWRTVGVVLRRTGR